jgi:hypothetical protein
MAMGPHTTIEELLETVFSMWSMPSGYITQGFQLEASAHAMEKSWIDGRYYAVCLLYSAAI